MFAYSTRQKLTTTPPAYRPDGISAPCTRAPPRNHGAKMTRARYLRARLAYWLGDALEFRLGCPTFARAIDWLLIDLWRVRR